MNIRFVGGLLSAYYLSGKEVRTAPKPPAVFSHEGEGWWRLSDRQGAFKHSKSFGNIAF